MKFKKGDKVKIIKDDNYKYDMSDSPNIGKEHVIVSVDESNMPYFYRVDGLPEMWSDEELELVEEKRNMSKFNVGDKVRVRKDLTNDRYFGEDGSRNSVVDGMLKFKGEVVTISKVRPNDGYFIEEDSWVWVDGMFENDVVIEDAIKTFTYKDIKEGDMITFEDGEEEETEMCWSCGNVVTDSHHGLENDMDEIVKIERKTVVYEKPIEVKEMTIEEISKALGYAVAVKGDK